MKIETIFMILAILLLIVLGVRGRLEVRLRSQNNEIKSLEQEVINNIDRIDCLNEQLESPKYSQPLDKIVISSIVGIRVNPLGGSRTLFHKGVDLVAKTGTPVKALLAGRVVGNWYPPGWYDGIYYRGHDLFGGCIIIDHGDQLFSTYGHLSKTIVHEDQWVKAGEKIGEVGNTGKSTGSHLHLELNVDPFKYLKERRKVTVSD